MSANRKGGEHRLRAAVIGLGVGEQHIHGYRSHPACDVVAICDSNPDKLREVAARHPGIRTSIDADAILRDPGIDVVSIASFDDAHHPQIRQALLAGKHVFAEKPLCLHAEEMEDIAGLLSANPALHLSSNLILRRSPRFQDLRNRILTRTFGELFLLEGDYNYGRVEKLTAGWRGRIPFYSVTHGGALHLIDLILWLSGRRPVEVFAYGSRAATAGTAFRHADTMVGLLRFDDRLVAKISANFGCVFPHHHNLAIYGTEATFVNQREGALLYVDRNPNTPPQAIDTPYPGIGKGDLIPGFIDGILSGAEGELPAAEVLAGMAVSLALERSMQEGRPVAPCYPVLPPRRPLSVPPTR
ncbi:Gfo/Idh/MocA family protein (plasmid) [Azospirillum melinis]|uniref:Gfo/Idh/MocA family protein n=1 Tax=Azospirillum melinis TaxID=328839 RepID=UPI003756DFD3